MDSRSEGVILHPFFYAKKFSMQKKDTLHIGILNFTATLIATFLVVYILVIGRSILVPLVAAVVIWYLMIRLASVFRHLPFTKIVFPDFLALIFAIIATGLILFLFVELLSNSINGIIAQAPLYQEAIKKILVVISGWTGSNIEFGNLLHGINFTNLFSNLALTLTNIASSLGIIIIYVLLLLFEYKTFDRKLEAVSGTKERFRKSSAVFDQISTEINSYMKIKAGLSLIAAVLSYIALYSFGISYPQFWAILIFLLYFIPTIGAIIATIITLIAISIHFNSLSGFIILASILIAIQFVVGNIIEPKWMGKNLNLSPLIILLALAFWGTIWGITGMFLCVPLMSILNIILAKFEKTRFLAILFAADPDTIR